MRKKKTLESSDICVVLSYKNKIKCNYFIILSIVLLLSLICVYIFFLLIVLFYTFMQELRDTGTIFICDNQEDLETTLRKIYVKFIYQDGLKQIK